jgi:hypothetical protein
MKINFNNKTKNSEIVFSWKEIWILIKKRKLTLSLQALDNFTVALINLRNSISKEKDKT